MTISLIAAIGLNNELGKNNQLLCSLPNDMKHFKKLTLGNFVCMGRKTYESIGHPLKNRHNIILTRNKKYKTPLGTYVYHSIENVIGNYQNQNNNESDLIFIGGSEIYKQALPYCDYIHLTIIEHKFPETDTYFPQFDLSDWKIISHIINNADEKNMYNHYFITYQRKNKNIK